MISIKENEKPKLCTMETHCDHILHPKLDKYELSKFWNKHSSNLVIGRPGQGKSSFIFALFRGPLRKVYNHIYYFIPEKSMASVKDNIFEKLPRDQIYHEFNYENLNEVLERINDAPKNETNVIIADDMASFLKQAETKQLMKMILQNKRHLSLSVFFLVQTYFSVEKDLRRIFDNFIIYKTSKNELENIFDEQVEQHKGRAMEISKLVYDKPYEFLFIHPESQRLFKSWDEIIITE